MDKQTAENGIGRGKAGPGRQKGVPNKTTALLKEAILKAAESTGEDGEGKDGLTGYCRSLAKNEPRAFATLLGKVLPMQIASEDNTVTVNIVRFSDLEESEAA